MIKLFERRKHQRIPISLPFNFYPKRTDTACAKGTIVNLSLGGMALETDVKFELGMKFFFRLDLPIRVLGRVVRDEEGRDANRYGIKFERIGIFDRLRLKKYLSRQSMAQCFVS